MRMLSPLSTQFSWPRRTSSPDLMGEMFEEFDRLVDSLSRPTFANTVGFQPSCDVSESKHHYLVSFDIPGVKRDHIKIEVKANQLVISGERQHEVKDENGEALIRHERTYGKFERVFTLPSSINSDKIEAHYENGVLSVALPKSESAKGRTIQIQSGPGGLFSKFLGSKKEGSRELKDVKVS